MILRQRLHGLRQDLDQGHVNHCAASEGQRNGKQPRVGSICPRDREAAKDR
ncbi:hypothetical protein [Falsiroseomonas sp. E2-1-a20]|uniref:hypothetical protein n=1 Tax=Falsiroseomonas sp. E2-1-a20 TaxID=3239300 RepID=UPI003F3CC6FE